MVTRDEFEARLGWRATIRRRQSIAFIAEGQGKHAGRFYEYPDDWFFRYEVGPPLETEINLADLRAQLEAGQIELLNGALP